MSFSETLFDRAKKVIPGGVNSPVRAFGSVGMTPRFIARADGDRIFDADGNEYIDFIGSWGPMILGHNHPAVLEAVNRAVKDGLSFGAATEREVQMAELICGIVPSIDMVRMVNLMILSRHGDSPDAIRSSSSRAAITDTATRSWSRQARV